jgi:hypothetical protein
MSVIEPVTLMSQAILYSIDARSHRIAWGMTAVFASA